MYVCNCNAIRERDAQKAILSGATTVKAVFNHCQTRPQCAKCVCDIRQMIEDVSATVRLAAE
ncbi:MULTISPECIES: bacterioferritin-associated ferredoxin [Asticcacaulis]|uniref:BFD domain protein (2Fe-2S)-binding domain protein n=3 Tax=Asticcacaulis TaxID=76890 RepID=E8RQN6_ASTEC|nr:MULTISPECIES: (2Fe-2S)-binding protein [Asticcacaulis]MDC7694523.1 (2Fe-2S)-binding protein [Asticcacaulis currens]BEV10948.1 (2Fe-2S)-binding protein [Asticcacaulis sp. DW145]ADU13264.1 BFD domain protein (2Fe-2S)-binding domain protein [Asticcacaulis excentricus CB 48]MCA1936977.1 (2Fe-2S)-binding protein [Asticcacaulis sp.]BBF79786.1 bacterioferritin-associated ferredoxin [Asticcacaulis excentricus]